MSKEIRSKTCPTCNSYFSYEKGKGKDRKHCSAQCRKKHRSYSLRIRRKNLPACSSASCGNKVRAPGASLCHRCYSIELKRRARKCQIRKCHRPATRDHNTICETHYYRMRRNGSYDIREPLHRYVTTAGYVKLYRPDHPLSDSNGYVAEHRANAYEFSGCNKYPCCFWCETPLSWSEAVIDHLNEIKDDNNPENLAISCNDCNRARGAVLPLIARMTDESFQMFVDVARKYRQSLGARKEEDRQSLDPDHHWYQGVHGG